MFVLGGVHVVAERVRQAPKPCYINAHDCVVGEWTTLSAMRW